MDLIGNWDVTLDFDGDDEMTCTAEIGADMRFTITCDDNGGNDDSGGNDFASTCTTEREDVIVSGSIEAATGSVKISEISRYSGSGCDSPTGQDIEKTEGDIALTRSEAGLGKLGGKWAAKVREWDCPTDADCDPADHVRQDDGFDCSFNLAADGSITISCSEFDEDHCDLTVITADGSIGGGEVSVTLKGFDVSDCILNDSTPDTLSIRAVRR
jgi:hypothetical protein